MREVRVDLGEQVVVPIFGMPRHEWSLFRDEHDMRDEDAYGPALIAACSPEMTLEDAQAAWDDWPVDVVLAVLIACVEECASDHTWAKERIEADPLLGVELAVCREYRIPLSTFHAWSERDQDLAIAHHALTLDHCPGCGSPTAAMKNPSLVKLTSRTCLVCQQKHEAHKTMPPEQSSYTHLSVVMAEETP